MQRSAEEWRGEDRYFHVMFRSFVFLSAHNLEADELHILHLGVSPYFVGSILWLLTYVCVGGDAQQAFE